MIWPRIWWGALAAGALAVAQAPTCGVEALSFPTGPGSGIAESGFGGAGWSFVPTTNLLVTSVGYLVTDNGGGDPNAVVAIWAGTNSVIASYTGITDPSAQPGDIISAAVPSLPLAAGQPYTITVYSSPLALSTWYGARLDNSGQFVDAPFEVAAELSQYEAWRLNRNNTFTPLIPDPGLNQQMLWLGPTFTYTVGSPPPRLTIAHPTADSVSLTWPTNAVGFVLQGSALVQGAYSNVTNAPGVSGTNYSTTLPATNAAAFFRLRKQS
jgi:hypothetical protein